MWDVQVLGAGWAGLSVAARLRARGVAVRVVDPRGALGGASGAATGIALPCLREHPHRTAASLGDAATAELFAFARDGLATLPGFRRTGVRWRAVGPEAEQVPDAVAAAGRLALAVERTEEGYLLQDGGMVDLAALRSAIETEVHTDEEAAEITIHATGWEVDGWFADKILPVRWQGQHHDGPALEMPVVSQHATVTWCGGLDAVGARWATPHMEVGETEPTPSEKVTAMLDRLTREAFPDAGPRTRTWAGIVADPCDGLPMIGPLPGRPREIALLGFGASGLPWTWRAAELVAEALLGRPAPEVPRPLRVSRFR